MPHPNLEPRMSSGPRPWAKDPVKKDQSKYRGADGKLRYSADGSEVYPGPTGVRRWPDRLGTKEA